MEKSNSFLESKPIGSLMRMYCIPCVTSLLAGSLYNIVDQIFIANANYLGSFGNAANTVVFPLTVAALAIAVMIGDGTCAFVSLCLGKGKKADADDSVGSAILLTVASSLVLTLFLFLFEQPILTLFGGAVNEQTYVFSQEYFFWIVLGFPVYMFGQAMNPIIRTDGSPAFAMAATLCGAAVNVILDPIFIYPLHMGMMGAAVATVLGQIVTAGLSIWYLFHLKAVSLDKDAMHFHWNVMKQYLPLGLTSFLSQISLVASMAVVQNMVMKYGAMDAVFGQADYAQIPLAVLGIVMKFFQIVISIAVGLAAGCIPIAGYNIGAGRNDRAKSLFFRLLGFEFAVGLCALILAECFPGQLIRLFGADQESAYYTDFAVKCFRIYLCAMPLATVNKGTFIYLQAMGKALESTLISLCREVVFGISLPILLPLKFGLDGVLYSFPAADILTFVIAVFVIGQTIRALSEKRSAALQGA